ncbi:MAG TPA: ribonuclease III [Pyrinomonadaceae bacterium]|jgi:ribonuclease-3|nr:ribonuclease III [Pyrinomonadaceae bacterium]
MSGKAGKLEGVIGHKFKNIDLLERALTHRSWAFENLSADDTDKIRESENESLEFLGDSVLGLIIAEHVFNSHPEVDEGGLTLMKHHLVSTVTLARVAETLDLGEYMRVGRGEEKTGGRRKQALLANLLEAVIGAVFVDGGYSAARVFVTRIFAEELKLATPNNSIDYKTTLQELLQARKEHAPTYKVVKTDGPPHAREFTVQASWETGKTTGRGSSIKAAEMMAAEEAINIVKAEHAKRYDGK